MVLKNKEEMEQHIVFFKYIFLIFSLSLLLCCNNKNQVSSTDNYYNFLQIVNEFKDTIQYKSVIKLNSKKDNLIS